MRRCGFTLLEIVLVCAIVVILTSIALPSFTAMYAQQKLSSSADEFRAGLITARAHAIEEGRPYRVALVPGKGNFRVAPDSTDAWSGGDPPPDASGKPAFVLDGTLSKGIGLSLASDPQRPDKNGDSALDPKSVGGDSWKTAAVFLPDGSARADAEINLLPAEGRGLVVVLRALTAETSVRVYSQGGR